MSLTGKVAEARKLLEEIYSMYGARHVAVAWTGGKDSTVSLHLWREFLQKKGKLVPRVLNLDTGLKFPEIIEFRDTVALRWGLDLEIARPDVELHSYPIAENSVECCGDLKVEPLSRAVKQHGIKVLLTGIRRDEHPDRDRGQKERREKPDALMVHPVLEFTEMDIWAYTVEYALPWCSLYAQGYRSLGCVPCTSKVQSGDGSHERAGRAASKEVNMELLRSMGYF